MQCPECGTEVADDRSSCPACGTPFDEAGGSDSGVSGHSSGRAGAGQSGDAHGGQSTGGQPGGGQSTGGQPGGGQSVGGGPAGGQRPSGGASDPRDSGAGQTGGPSGQPSQPTQGPGQSTAGGQQRAGGGQVSGGGQQQYQQPQGSGSGFGDIYQAYLADLPVVGGIVAGVLIYIVGFVVTALVAFAASAPAPGPVDVSLELVAELFYNAQFTTLSSGDPTFSRLPATLGVSFVLVPWLLFVAGARFGRWHGYESIGLPEQVFAGATVVAGYLPAVAIGAAFMTPGDELFPPDYASVLLFAGLLYPIVCGGVGGAVSYFFDEFGGLRAQTTGVLLGLTTLVLTYGVTFVSVDSSLHSEPIGLALVSGLSYIAGHLFAIDGDGGWFMLMLLPLVLVAIVGFLRARRARVTTWLDGVRAGGSFAFGYATAAFIALLLAAIASDFGPDLADEANVDTLAALAEISQSLTLETALTPPQFLEWFLVIGVGYPLIIGGLAGAGHVLIQRTLTDNANETPSN